MSKKKVDKKPENANKALKLGDRPPFVSQFQHYVIQGVVIIFGLFLLRYRYFFGPSAHPNELSILPDLNYSSQFNRDSWGSFRPQAYFSLKKKQPNSPLFGLAWYSHAGPELLSEFRYYCAQNDGVKYLWEATDAKTFGKQNIVDGPLNISTSWVNRDASWASEISIKRKDQGTTGVILYFMAQESETSFNVEDRSGIPKVWIHTPGQPDYSLEFDISSKINTYPSILKLHFDDFSDPTKFVEIVKRNLGIDQNKGFIHFNGQANSDSFNLFALHLDVSGDAEVSIEFKDQSEPDLPNFDELFNTRLEDFNENVKHAFAADVKTVNNETFIMAKRALANLLGGIGYWHGEAKMKSKSWDVYEVKPYGPIELFSAIPSRPFFPRGFIWDEGFHNLLIHKFDSDLSLDIFSSWLNTLNTDGWMPREMILGHEAESKVPAEFLVQSDEVANPPVFFVLIEKFVNNPKFMAKHRTRLLSMYPRLKQWYVWLKNTQQGPYKGILQWQGRNTTTNLELNPKTLPSGLDDYPRATHPSIDEYHLDIRCWMAVASRVIRYLAELSSDNAFIKEADDDQRAFNDIDTLNKYHWSSEKKRYADYGLHSKSVKLITIREPNQEPIVIRKVLDEPKKQLVDDVYGYVTLFPFLMKLLPSNSDELATILSELDDPELLWSPYGLRSVAKSCSYYNQRNTQHDAPYWRGNIWININYLALEALFHYSEQGGPHSERASVLHKQLKANIINTIQKSFNQTGVFWEHYSDKTGKGGGTRPFTGWTSLIFAIVADNYD